MPNRVETLHPAVTHLVVGHFHEGKGYSVWRSNGTEDWLLIYTAGGRGRFGFAGGEIVVEPGDLVLIRPGVLHDYGVEPSISRWELLWTHFHPRGHWIGWLDWPTEAKGLHRLRVPESQRELVEATFREVDQRTRSAHRRRLEFAMNALEELLLVCDELNPNQAQAKMDPRVREAMDFICGHFHEPIDLDAIAEAAGLSTSRLSHLFKEQVGTSVQKFLESQRIARAKQLLEFTPRSVKEIARDVGYDNPFYFSMRFRSATGRSPRAWRASG
jgi:AraC family transcriptional regulator of arabinose operon